MQNDGTQKEEGALRLMTLGKLVMARRAFGDSIVHSRVWIHCDSYFPFGLQTPGGAMAPNGELWFRKRSSLDDFSGTNASAEDQHTFIHELGYAWHHQHGQRVRMRGLFSWAADYYYKLDKERLNDYSLEQHASIIADYWLILVYGIDKRIAFLSSDSQGKYRGDDEIPDIPGRYRKIVTGRE